MATKTSTAPKSSTGVKPPVPVLKVTRYETVSTSMIVVVIGLAIAVFLLILVWMSHHRWEVAPETEYKVLFTDNPGGFLEGTEGETLGGAEGPPAQFSDVESSPETEQDPNHEETETIEMDVAETIDSVNSVAQMSPPQMLPRHAVNVGERNEGMNFKQKGTGRKGLGDGPGVGGFGREQRWFVRFDEGGTLDEYAKQLDFFKIELGAILREGVLVYLTNLAAAKPSERRVTATEDEKRLYMVHQGNAARRKADDQLFQKAGIDPSGALVLHFYPPATEQLLAQAEEAYRGRKAKDIARTFFKVRDNGSGGYEFIVTGQTTLK